MMCLIKTYFKQFLLVALVLWGETSVAFVSAQSHVGFSLSGHVPVAFDNVTITRPMINYGAEIGFVYEWHKNNFILQTGINYALLCPKLSVAYQDLEQEMIDTRGVLFTYRGALDNRTDQMAAGMISVPLYFGGYWNGLYAMAGAKMNLILHAKADQYAQLKTVGDYHDRYYDWFENMPNHGYHDYMPVHTSQDMLCSRLNVMVGAEIGYMVQWTSTYRRQDIMRIGLFAEYGLLDIRNQQTKDAGLPRTQPDYSQYMNVHMNHIYMSDEAGKSDAHLLTCGLRITFLFPVSDDPVNHKHYPCRCYIY